MTLPTDLQRTLAQDAPDEAPVPAQAHLQAAARDELALTPSLVPLAEAADRARQTARDLVLAAKETRTLDRSTLAATLDENLADLRAEAQRIKEDVRLKEGSRQNFLDGVRARRAEVVRETLEGALKVEARLLSKFPHVARLPTPARSPEDRQEAMVTLTRLQGAGDEAVLRAFLERVQAGDQYVAGQVAEVLRERLEGEGTLLPGSTLHQAQVALDLWGARDPVAWKGSVARERALAFRSEAATLARDLLEFDEDRRGRFQITTA